MRYIFNVMYSHLLRALLPGCQGQEHHCYEDHVLEPDHGDDRDLQLDLESGTSIASKRMLKQLMIYVFSCISISLELFYLAAKAKNTIATKTTSLNPTLVVTVTFSLTLRVARVALVMPVR